MFYLSGSEEGIKDGVGNFFLWFCGRYEGRVWHFFLRFFGMNE